MVEYDMKQKIIKTAFLLLFFSVTNAASLQKEDPDLTALLFNSATYICTDTGYIKADYYSLSDNSLFFVKLAIGNKILTLPALVSASGVRYTDERDIQWWIKGDNATLSKRDNYGKWIVIDNCKITKKDD